MVHVRNLAACSITIGYDQQDLSPTFKASVLKLTHNLSIAIFATMTFLLKKAAVPHEPSFGPIFIPSTT